MGASKVSLDDMMVFCRVAENGSFTKAANDLGISKARVSQVISQLEDAVGSRLMHRTTRSLSLTDVGEGYYQRCKVIEELAEEANSAVEGHRDEPSGILRVSTPLGVSAIGELLSQFVKQYPQITLDVVESDEYQNLIESQCDLAIRTATVLEDSSLYAARIGEINDIICASPEYLSNFGEIATPADLQQLDWVSHHTVQGNMGIDLVSPKGMSIKVMKRARVSVRSATMLRQFLIDGVGFGMLPNIVVAKELQSGELVQILGDYHDVSIPMYAVYVDKKYMPLNLKVLLRFLKEHRITL
ncbi:LysR family transcriptional regulator [Vibrio cidicii]|uniref:LysR family transcriptional regulator n=1 Tax=Vibrio cidicii TaxID=1763883 RepID=A0ABR5VZT2_9VIBR|nr:LysR family transcriptional regulator [Vibrio cidicii]KYN85051.1 LysR family transcriptional regulator [Vibrio cidicii]